MTQTSYNYYYLDIRVYAGSKIVYFHSPSSFCFQTTVSKTRKKKMRMKRKIWQFQFYIIAIRDTIIRKSRLLQCD